MPWHVSRSQSNATITFYTEHELRKGDLVITFEAFDINLQSVGVTLENVHRYGYASAHFHRYSSVLITRNNTFSLFDTEFQIYVVGFLMSKIVVKHPVVHKPLRDKNTLQYGYFPHPHLMFV